MPGYRIYFVGEDGHFKSVREEMCETDEEAIDSAKQLLDGHDLEVWQLNRWVAKLHHRELPDVLGSGAPKKS